MLLKSGFLYKIKARNSAIGIFRLQHPYMLSNNLPIKIAGFEIARSKMGATYLDYEIIDCPAYEVPDDWKANRTAEVVSEIESAPIFSNDENKLSYLIAQSKKICPQYLISRNLNSFKPR